MNLLFNFLNPKIWKRKISNFMKRKKLRKLQYKCKKILKIQKSFKESDFFSNLKKMGKTQKNSIKQNLENPKIFLTI